ncbi:lactosylceramide 4-alpha-galactosyltransferase-like [Sitodiplosis mosellana]|uniref:lactosylceramide 4-alpha-galactosyltransferase-like n=1 Tax=Sitodiplosis mosellana TaxID=263140 RepID=UPI0024446707|nr:lactosylceramide 4-alpha-galactosyltransferase-like [Sitodiplosis mosellana]
MDELPANFLGKEAFHGKKVYNVNNAVMGFQNKIGQGILELCLKELIASYNPHAWNHNGGALQTRVLEHQVCNTSLVEMTPEKCHGFKVFPKEEFYAINWDDWEQFFNANHTETVLEAIQGSSVIHLWNKLSHSQIIAKSKSKTAYEILAEKNCPKAFETSGKYF